MGGMSLAHGFSIGSLRVRPGLALAPMEGHTDSSFRRLVKALGGCGLVYSEMTTAGALVKGNVLVRTGLKVFLPEERPVAFQVTGCDPAEVAEAARRFAALGPTSWTSIWAAHRRTPPPAATGRPC